MPYGYGRHAYYLDQNDLTVIGEMEYIGDLVWVWTLTLVKISMCLLLYRIRKTWFVGMSIFGAFQFAVVLATTVIHFVRCSPIRANWEYVPHSRCWTTQAITISYYVLSGMPSIHLPEGFRG
jgi:hypothetical protein